MKTKLSVLLLKHLPQENRNGDIQEEVIRYIRHTIDEIKGPINVGEGFFWYLERAQQEPKWMKSFFPDGTLDDETKNKLKNQTVQAIYIQKVTYNGDERYFAIPFGIGRYLLKQDVVEERFGLRVLLNSSDSKKIKTLDYHSLLKTSKQSHIQMGQDSDIKDFDIDFDQDLVKALSAKCNIDGNEVVISGKDSLVIHSNRNCSDIGNLLSQLIEKYNSEIYQENFKWLDNIKPVKEQEEKARLDGRLLEILNDDNPNFDDLVILVMPEMVDREVAYFIFDDNNHQYESLSLDEYLTEVNLINREITSNHLRKHHLTCKDDNDNPIKTWTLYRCLYAEININENSHYVLDDGEWYKFSDDYTQQIRNKFNNIEDDQEVNMIECPIDNFGKQCTEKEYNNAQSLIQGYHLMDCQLITLPHTSSIEVCDVFKEGKYLIHVKKGNSSSVLSHLFNQGLVSAQIVNSKQGREVIREKFHDNVEVVNSFRDESYKVEDFKVVYAIIFKDNNDRIPFFSQIIACNVKDQLDRLGMKMIIKKIPTAAP